jgi:hypothetical protein
MQPKLLGSRSSGGSCRGSDVRSCISSGSSSSIGTSSASVFDSFSNSWSSHRSWLSSYRSCLFFFTTSSECSSSDHGCQNDRFVHF